MIIKNFELFENASLQPPRILLDNIESIEVKYINFDGDIKTGNIICNRGISNDLREIFEELLNRKFPIYQIKPISEFNNDDEESVKANNTSCYNYRFVLGSNKMSDHSTGNAIDINPIQNPWLSPLAIQGLEYDISKPGTVDESIVSLFKRYGFSWGGYWKTPDYQHFFKPDLDLKNKILNADKSKIDRFRDYIKDNGTKVISRIKNNYLK